VGESSRLLHVVRARHCDSCSSVIIHPTKPLRRPHTKILQRSASVTLRLPAHTKQPPSLRHCIKPLLPTDRHCRVTSVISTRRGLHTSNNQLYNRRVLLHREHTPAERNAVNCCSLGGVSLRWSIDTRCRYQYR